MTELAQSLIAADHTEALAIERERQIQAYLGRPTWTGDRREAEYMVDRFCQRELWCVKAPGHPGECPETPAESRARTNAAVKRDHPFVGEGEYCTAMIGQGISGSPETGLIMMATGCGYPRQHHPDENGFAPGD